MSSTVSPRSRRKATSRLPAPSEVTSSWIGTARSSLASLRQLGARSRDVEHHEPRAVGGEGASDRRADAASGTGDQRGAARPAEVNAFSVLLPAPEETVRN